VSTYPTTNTLAWLKECRRRNKNAMRNTGTGDWLRVACLIIEQQFQDIQAIRNEQIDKASGVTSTHDYDYFD
jgi:hypothetical protein